MPPYIVCIDGNIGSGKSTLLDSLSDRGFKVYKEGIDKWTDVLENFYKDKSRWAFSLQVAILVKTFNILQKCSQNWPEIERDL